MNLSQRPRVAFSDNSMWKHCGMLDWRVVSKPNGKDEGMVWGMALPTSFGASFPNGEYVGWRKGLLDYFENEMPAERKTLFYNSLAYPSYVLDKFIKEPDPKGAPGKPPFTPIEPHEAPKQFVLQKKYTGLGSLINTESRILAADEPLKDIIERFEPGVHQFLPIEISMPSTENYETKFELYPKRFYILIIGQYINGFSPAQSDSNSWKEMLPGRFQYNDGPDSMSRLALAKQEFGAAHLWRERRMALPLICFSDALMAEIEKARLRLPKHYRLKEI